MPGLRLAIPGHDLMRFRKVTSIRRTVPPGIGSDSLECDGDQSGDVFLQWVS